MHILKTPGAYFNEFDPGAAAWLRELIKAGFIADGDVDERSILDVRHSELRSYTQCHFFAGIGGWSYALRLAGWPDDRPVWTGSPPCQPFSVAGAGKGRDDARHLAPHFISLVGAARPGLLFGEQVASADVFGKAAKRARGNFVAPPDWAWLDDLSDRLEAARYAVGASDFPSAGVGAPHIRQRTFFGAVSHEWMANDASLGWFGRRAGEAGFEPGAQQRSDGFCDVGRMGNPNGARGATSIPEPAQRHEGQPEVADHGVRGLSGPDARRSTDGGLADQSRGGRREERQDGRGGAVGDPEEGIATGLGPSSSHNWPGPLHGFWRDADWLFCRDGKWRPVEPGLKPLAHGVSGRVGLLRGYGNAINPHAAAEFIRSFDEAAGGMRVAA